MKALGGKKKYSDNLGMTQSITKSNKQILDMGKKGYYLPGYNKENYTDLVSRNTDTLITNQTAEEERRKREADAAEKKDDSILGNVYEEISSGHFFRDVAGFFKKTVDGTGDVISAISNSPKYLMYAAGIILLIILLKK